MNRSIASSVIICPTFDDDALTFRHLPSALLGDRHVDLLPVRHRSNRILLADAHLCLLLFHFVDYKSPVRRLILLASHLLHAHSLSEHLSAVQYDQIERHSSRTASVDLLRRQQLSTCHARIRFGAEKRFGRRQSNAARSTASLQHPSGVRRRSRHSLDQHPGRRSAQPWPSVDLHSRRQHRHVLFHQTDLHAPPFGNHRLPFDTFNTAGHLDYLHVVLLALLHHVPADDYLRRQDRHAVSLVGDHLHSASREPFGEFLCLHLD